MLVLELGIDESASIEIILDKVRKIMMLRVNSL